MIRWKQHELHVLFFWIPNFDEFLSTQIFFLSRWSEGIEFVNFFNGLFSWRICILCYSAIGWAAIRNCNGLYSECNRGFSWESFTRHVSLLGQWEGCVSVVPHRFPRLFSPSLAPTALTPRGGWGRSREGGCCVGRQGSAGGTGSPTDPPLLAPAQEWGVELTVVVC